MQRMLESLADRCKENIDSELLILILHFYPFAWLNLKNWANLILGIAMFVYHISVILVIL